MADVRQTPTAITMHATDLQTFNQLVASLYRGPLEVDPWSEFLASLRLQTGANLTVLGLRRPSPALQGVVFVSHAGAVDSRDLGATYRSQHLGIDPFVNLPDGNAVTLHEMMPADELDQLPYYRDFMLTRDYVFHLGVDTYFDNHVALYIRVTRGHSGADFGQREKELLNLLAPHLRNVTMWLDQQERQLSERLINHSVVNQLALGSVVLDRQGTIIAKNPTAQHILNQEDELIEKGGKLSGQTASTNKSLQALSSKTSSDKQAYVMGSIKIPRHNHPQPLYLTIKPNTENILSSGPTAPHRVVFIHAPEMSTACSDQSLQEMLDLTPKETRFAIELANGFTLDEIADNFNVSRNTIRTHLQRIYHKTGVNKQAALVNLVLRCIASLG